MCETRPFEDQKTSGGMKGLVHKNAGEWSPNKGNAVVKSTAGIAIAELGMKLDIATRPITANAPQVETCGEEKVMLWNELRHLEMPHRLKCVVKRKLCS